MLLVCISAGQRASLHARFGGMQAGWQVERLSFDEVTVPSAALDEGRVGTGQQQQQRTSGLQCSEPLPSPQLDATFDVAQWKVPEQQFSKESFTRRGCTVVSVVTQKKGSSTVRMTGKASPAWMTP